MSTRWNATKARNRHFQSMVRGQGALLIHRPPLPDPHFPQGVSGPEGSEQSLRRTWWVWPSSPNSAKSVLSSGSPLTRVSAAMGAGDIQEGLGCVHLKGEGVVEKCISHCEHWLFKSQEWMRLTERRMRKRKRGEGAVGEKPQESNFGQVLLTCAFIFNLRIIFKVITKWFR